MFRTAYLLLPGALVHFGLGEGTQIDSLEVVWPSGKREVYTGVTVNRFIKIVESDTTVVEMQH